VPQGTRDFTAVLLKTQQRNPDVVAAAVGGDDLKAMRAQVAQMKLGTKYAWINNQQDWPMSTACRGPIFRRVRHDLVPGARAPG
jgi:branched-chain amino acid transport system substrate-binding protein